MGRRPQPQLRERLLTTCTDHALAHGLPDRLEPLVRATGGDLLGVRPGEPYTQTLQHAWTVMTGPDGQPYLRIFGPLRESAEQRLWPGFRRIATTDWLGPLEDGLRTLGRPGFATLVLAVIRGLLMDLDATGDTARADQAFADFVSTLESARD